MATSKVYQLRKKRGLCASCCKPNDNKPLVHCKSCSKKKTLDCSRRYYREKQAMQNAGVHFRAYNVKIRKLNLSNG